MDDRRRPDARQLRVRFDRNRDDNDGTHEHLDDRAGADAADAGHARYYDYSNHAFYDDAVT